MNERMKSNRRTSLALIALLLAALPAGADELEDRFQNPPEATRPRCY